MSTPHPQPPVSPDRRPEWADDWQRAAVVEPPHDLEARVLAAFERRTARPAAPRWRQPRALALATAAALGLLAVFGSVQLARIDRPTVVERELAAASEAPPPPPATAIEAGAPRPGGADVDALRDIDRALLQARAEAADGRDEQREAALWQAREHLLDAPARGDGPAFADADPITL